MGECITYIMFVTEVNFLRGDGGLFVDYEYYCSNAMFKCI
jgi:hypothetical protein